MIVDIGFKIKRGPEQIQGVSKVGMSEGNVWIHHYPAHPSFPHVVIEEGQYVSRIPYKHIKFMRVTND